MISARKNENDMAMAIESLVVRFILHAMISAQEFEEKGSFSAWEGKKQTLVGMHNAVAKTGNGGMVMMVFPLAMLTGYTDETPPGLVMESKAG